MQTVDQRIQALEQAMNAVPSALLNAVLAIVSALNNQDSIDKKALKAELEELKSVHIENGNQKMYEEILTMVLSRLS
ncbi:hypothetical protein [Pseudomonas shahriarae]|uniref:hypothetical protein n=1 Tax=Pseudomonas shahriarae TaxID=2745512 RepID=UPI002362DCBD|nr:hypothetical protein [Pseudomonas shahriarae]MDD1130483.1 hypothetical protein [Pseudomonas shahriarae]